MTPRSETKVVSISGVNAASTGDTVLFRPKKPIDIIRWGFIVEVLLDVGVGATFSIDHRPTIGSDTDRAEIGAITVSADVAAGKGQYDDLADAVAASTGVDGSTVNVGTGNPFQVDPGEEVVFDVDDAADTAGTITVFIEYNEKPFVGSRIANMTDVG